MNYAEEKEIVEKKWKLWKRVALIAVSVLLLSLCVFSCFVPADTWKYHFSLPKIRARADGELRMHFLDVGEGDCSLIEFPDGKVMLVDGGDGAESTATTILRYLNALKIKTIDYVLLTHSDADHCGGLDTVLKQKEVKTVYAQKVSPTIHDEYAEFYDAVLEENCEIELLSRGAEIVSTRSDCPYTFRVLLPYTKDLEDVEEIKTDTNAFSTAFWLDYYGTSAFFAADIPESCEKRLVQDSKFGLLDVYGVDLTSTEILKVAHHGSASSSSAEFLSHLGVKTAVISCARTNLYGHPAEETCRRLQEVGAQEYRTYDGHVMITARKNGEYTVERIAA